LLKSENQPNAAFAAPVVTLARALAPSAVLNVPPTLPGSGVAGNCITWGLRFARISGPVGHSCGACGAAVPSCGAACAPGKSAKQTISNGMSKEPPSGGASPLQFLRFTLNDVSVLRIIFFIVSRSCRARGFLGIRRIAYECSCPALPLPVKKADRKLLCPTQISAAWRR
jgi:hypothetical protein